MSSVEQGNIKLQKYVSEEDYNKLRAAYEDTLNELKILPTVAPPSPTPLKAQNEKGETIITTHSEKEANNIKYRYAASKINAMMWISVVLGFVSTCVAMASAQYQLTSELIVGSGLEPLVLYGMFSVIFTVCVVLVSIIYVIVLWCKISK